MAAYRRHDIEVSCVNVTSSVDAPAGTRSLGAIPQDIENCNYEKLASDYARIERELAPDLVVAGPLADVAYIKARANTPIGWIAQSWAFDVLWEAVQSPRAEANIRSVLRDCRFLLCDCRAVLEACRGLAFSGISFSMPWGLDVDSGAEGFSIGDKALKPPTNVLYSRGFGGVYNGELLLQAWAHVSAELPHSTLYLAGRGSLAPALTEKIRALGIGASVRQLGLLDQASLAAAYKDAHVSVSCAGSDGTSLSLLDAFYFGIVPIVPRVGGNPEWVDDRRNGFLYDLGDVGQLSAALRAAFGMSREDRTALLERNRKQVLERADWSRNFSLYLAWLRECVA